jgi:hypothetical protein
VDSKVLIILCLLVCNILSCLVGYILGKLSSLSNIAYGGPKSFFTKEKLSQATVSPVEIDEKKFVGDINTSGLEKKYTDIADIKQSNENISSSVNKLKNLKR